MSPSKEELRQLEVERLRGLELKDDLSWVLSTVQGRRFYARLVYELGALQVQGYHQDARQHAFHDGQRQVGVALDREAFLVDREGWAAMHRERLERLRAQELPKQLAGE